MLNLNKNSSIFLPNVVKICNFASIFMLYFSPLSLVDLNQLFLEELLSEPHPNMACCGKLHVFARAISLTRSNIVQNSWGVSVLSHAQRRHSTSAPATPKISKEREGAAASQKDFFVDGDVKEKRTLRRKLEKLALSPDADLSQSSIVAAKVRRKLQAHMKAKIKAQTPVEEKEDIPKSKFEISSMSSLENNFHDKSNFLCHS